MSMDASYTRLLFGFGTPLSAAGATLVGDDGNLCAIEDEASNALERLGSRS